MMACFSISGAGGGTNGIAAQIAGTGIENGMPFVAVRFTGTVPSGTGSGYIWFEGSTAIVGVNGDTFAHSYFAKLEAVAAGGIATHQAWIAELTSTATVVRQGFENQAVPGTGRLAAQRAVQVMTLSGGATVARIRPFAAFCPASAPVRQTGDVEERRISGSS
jgi:hypothetical protein